MNKDLFYGIVLAGGKSVRMGSDKSMLTLSGRTFLEIQVEKLRRLGMAEIMISGKDSSLPGTVCVPDIIKDVGPLGGFYSCFQRCEGHPALVLSVDVPLVSEETLRTLMDTYINSSAEAVVLSCRGKHEPLIAIYNTNTFTILEELISSGDLAVSSFLSRINLRPLSFEGNIQELLNCNTPEDYKGLCV